MKESAPNAARPRRDPAHEKTLAATSRDGPGSSTIEKTRYDQATLVPMDAMIKCVVLVASVALSASSLMGCKRAAPQRSALTKADAQHPANARFLASLAPSEDWMTTPMLSGVKAWPAFAAGQAVAGHPDKLLVVLFFAPPDPGQPPMQIMLFAKDQNTDRLIGHYGDPLIIGNLNEAQSSHVIARGVPPGLVAEVLETAEQQGWKSSLARGQTVTQVLIDVDEHFP